MSEGVWRPLWFASPQRSQRILVVATVVLLLSVPGGITRAVSKSSRGREEEEDGT